MPSSGQVAGTHISSLVSTNSFFFARKLTDTYISPNVLGALPIPFHKSVETAFLRLCDAGFINLEKHLFLEPPHEKRKLRN